MMLIEHGGKRALLSIVPTTFQCFHYLDRVMSPGRFDPFKLNRCQICMQDTVLRFFFLSLVFLTSSFLRGYIEKRINKL